MAHGGLENCDLPQLQVEKVFRFEFPFDFRVARQRSCAGARDIHQHAVKVCAVRQSERVRRDHFYVLLRRESSQKRCPMRMQLGRNDLCFRQSCGHGSGFASGSGAAIEYAPTIADQSGNELRAFILDGEPAVGAGGGLGDVAGNDDARVPHEIAGSELDALFAQFALGGCGVSTEADVRGRDFLVGFADALSSREAVVVGPALHEPNRMREGRCQRSRRDLKG